LKILFIGDIMGNPGRRAVSEILEALRSSVGAQFVIANGENSAGGFGIASVVAKEMFKDGVDVITLGNHTWSQRQSHEYIAQEPRVLRPENYPPGCPGRGWGIYEAENGVRVGVLSLLGRTFMAPVDCPFRTADNIIEQAKDECDVIIVDMHAEATSEKMALGWYLNGRASAVVGTHTHIQTSDERVLFSGTAYISDVGMTGAHDSVLGMDPEMVIEKFKTQMPGKIKLADGEPTLQAVIIDIDEATGRAVGIKRISIKE